MRVAITQLKISLLTTPQDSLLCSNVRILETTRETEIFMQRLLNLNVPRNLIIYFYLKNSLPFFASVACRASVSKSGSCHVAGSGDWGFESGSGELTSSLFSLGEPRGWAGIFTAVWRFGAKISVILNGTECCCRFLFSELLMFAMSSSWPNSV